MGLRWCLWSDFSADSTGWFPTSVCVCELHRKGESQTGWCHLHCATALFKDTGKLTPFSLPSPCPKHDTVQSRWRPPPWPRGEVVFTGSHRDLLSPLWGRFHTGAFGEGLTLVCLVGLKAAVLHHQRTALKSTWKWWFGKLLVWTPSTVFNEYEWSSPRVNFYWLHMISLLAYNAFSVAASFHRNWIKLFVSIALHLQSCWVLIVKPKVHKQE